MNWKSSLVAAGVAIGAAQMAQATVEAKLYADTYIVWDGGRIYSVLDIYAKGNHLGDSLGSILGLSTHPVVFATNQATGVTRNECGKIIGGGIVGDIFVQAGNSGWCPSNCCGPVWDSFVGSGARKQCAQIVNRYGLIRDSGSCSSWNCSGGFVWCTAPNQNHIPNGATSGWSSTFGSNPYNSAGSSENPFARVALYWIAPSAYPSLELFDCDGRSLLHRQGRLQSGVACASAAPLFQADDGPGDPLDALGAYFWMIGRFTIEVTGKPNTEVITMNVQFNMTGRNGTGNEAGTTFSGAVASTAQYKVSQFFAFAMPPSCPSDLNDNLVVDPADVSLLLLDFGSCVGCPSDLDGSGVTDTADLSLLLLDFGPCA